jgi:hypothetical protein
MPGFNADQHSVSQTMQPPYMTTRTLIAIIVIVALSLTLILEHHRAAKHEVAMRADHEERLNAALRDVRKLQKQELMRLEDNYRRLREELKEGNTNPKSDARVIAAEAEIRHRRTEFNETVDQLRASLKRVQAMGFPGIRDRSIPSAKPNPSAAGKSL